MPIERIDKFLETTDLGITHSLGIETNQINECIAEIKSRHILGVFGCPIFGFKQSDFDFFEKIPFIKQVWFWETNIKNIDGLYTLDDLEYFGVSEKRPPIDFSKFQKLKKVVWHPIKNDSGLEKINNLNELHIWRLKPSNKSYENIPNPCNLKKLDLNWCNPTSLKGMPTLNNLEELQIHYCRNLESIATLFDIAPNLKKLIITRCSNLTDYAVVKDHEWEHLFIHIRGKTVANKKIKRTPTAPFI
ncbi:hypothetical protein [Kistimonas asteriae]|uniref:hypothetical protein n=1 Tax=Kistimonas asteriae TaxID=517724 RepID=UPI001BA58864|nr:hypothetical protein [Kistimonas asteriae]